VPVYLTYCPSFTVTPSMLMAVCRRFPCGRVLSVELGVYDGEPSWTNMGRIRPPGEVPMGTKTVCGVVIVPVYLMNFALGEGGVGPVAGVVGWVERVLLLVVVVVVVVGFGGVEMASFC
jgi:hypothetical protein